MDDTHAQLREACGRVAAEHKWAGNSPEGPTSVLKPPRVHRRRHSMGALHHSGNIRMKNSGKRAAAQSYLAQNQRRFGSKARVAVRKLGTYTTRRFRGVLWVGSACVAVADDAFKLLRVCDHCDVTLTYYNADHCLLRSTHTLSSWQATGVAMTEGKLVRVDVRKVRRCLQTYSSLVTAYADNAVPAHKMIYATPGHGAPHPVALINRGNFVVCPTCHEVFGSTVELSMHLGLKDKWSRMNWKTFI